MSNPPSWAASLLRGYRPMSSRTIPCCPVSSRIGVGAGGPRTADCGAGLLPPSGRRGTGHEMHIRDGDLHECAQYGRAHGAFAQVAVTNAPIRADARMRGGGDAGLRRGGAGRRASARGGLVSSARLARCGAGRLTRSARSAADHMPDRTGCMNDGAPGMVSRCDASALPVALLRSCRHPTGLCEAACAGYPEYGWRHAAPATGDMRVRPPHLIQIDVCRTPNPLHLMEIAAARPVSPAGRRAIGRMEGSFPRVASSARTG